MTTAGVAQLKARLSEYLARVKAGEEVVVTDHGRPVAKLVPAFDADEHLRELERQGLVRIGTGKLPPGVLRPAASDRSGGRARGSARGAARGPLSAVLGRVGPHTDRRHGALLRRARDGARRR